MPERPLAGRVALVTGGGTGIGLAISQRLAALGAAVAVHQRTVEKANAGVEAVQAQGGYAAPVVSDLATAAGCRDAVAGCLEAFGRIDILINNAAVCAPIARHLLGELDTPVVERNSSRISGLQLPGPPDGALASELIRRTGGWGTRPTSPSCPRSFRSCCGDGALGRTRAGRHGRGDRGVPAL
jgi:NAD(P)-dependent dehydrogenase (short-subunit alcohol dehydrogenase family)